MEEEVKKVDLITLLRTFKKEGLDNFIVIRKEKFENNFIPKSKVKEKIEELKKKIDVAQGEELLILDSKVDVLEELLREE